MPVPAFQTGFTGDLPGYLPSHGCIGLYDEAMQKEQYGTPTDPKLNDAKRLFDWVFRANAENNDWIQRPEE